MAEKKSTKAAAASKALEKAETQAPVNASERFTAMVMKEYGESVGASTLTEHQKQLIQNYFIGVDRALKDAEIRRVEKNAKNTDHEKWDNPLPVTWSNVNLQELALDVVYYSRIGLDLLEENHLSAIPYRNGHTNKYDVVLMRGYVGMEYTAKKYALEPPKNVVTELVYSNDHFAVTKKDRNHDVESYEFNITNPFDRGQIIGGFGYIQYDDETKNKLIIMSINEIEKRKPEKASANFWGNWYEQMCLKTVRREVYSKKNIPLDPDKIDENILRIQAREAAAAERLAQEDIDVYANSVDVIIDDYSDADIVTPKLAESSSTESTPVPTAPNVAEDELP